MRGRRIFALAAAAALVLAAPAIACTVILPVPGEGETLAQVAFRQDGLHQRRLRGEATAVYLARVTPARDGFYFRATVPIEGEQPPRRAEVRPGPDCEPSSPAPGELRIVFARRVRPADDFWRPWRWGRQVVIGSRRPAEVADLGLARALRDAAARVRR